MGPIAYDKGCSICQEPHLPSKLSNIIFSSWKESSCKVHELLIESHNTKEKKKKKEEEEHDIVPWRPPIVEN